MKVHCPRCRTPHDVPEERIAENGIKATCKECGTEMIIRRQSGEVRVSLSPPQDAVEEVESPGVSPVSPGEISKQPDENDFSILNLSPAYPRHRDAWIVFAAAVLLAMILAGGYLVLGGAKMPSLKTEWNPITSFLRIITGGDVYETCETFIHQNETLFRSFGKNLQVSLIRQNVKSVNGKKTATVLVKVQGAKATGRVYFQLRKAGDAWRVLTAAMSIGRGKYEKLYPRSKSRRGGKI